MNNVETVKAAILNLPCVPMIEPSQPNTIWSDPEPIPELPAVEPFDFDLMPEQFKDWFVDVAERMQCPPDFLGVAVICGIGSILGRKVAICPKMHDLSWYEYPNLWGCIIGIASLLKTPTLSAALKPFRSIENDEYAAYKNALKEWSIEKKGDEPNPKRLSTNDTSTEKLADNMSKNPNGLLVFSDEIVGYLKGLEKPGQESARAFMLTAWNGKEPYTIDRIVRGTIHIEACCASLLGGTQPSAIASYIDDAVSKSGGDGLMARMQLLVYPDINKTWELVDRRVDEQAEKVVDQIFRRLHQLDLNEIQAKISDDGVPYLQFNTEAFDRFSIWWKSLEMRLRSGTLPSVLEAHLGKYRKLVPALALIFHLIDDPDAGAIGLVSLQRALAWAEYLESHAIRVYAFVSIPDHCAASELLKKIKLKRWDQFTAKEVYKNHWAELDNTERVQLACEVLVKYGWLKSEVTSTGGRPSEIYLVNPRWIAQWANL